MTFFTVVSKFAGACLCSRLGELGCEGGWMADAVVTACGRAVHVDISVRLFSLTCVSCSFNPGALGDHSISARVCPNCD